MATTRSPLATTADFTEFGSNSELVENEDVWNDQTINRLLIRATTAIESRCQRRLAPFTGKEEMHTAYGVDPDEYGEQSGMPMDLTGALGWSQAAAMGVSDMVRKVWLDENPPMFQEMWAYDVQSVELVRTFGDHQTFTGAALLSLQGPEFDTGQLKFQIGTYCPIGSTIRITYGGGYSTVPDDLNLACIFQAMKFLVLGSEPELPSGMSTRDLDEEIIMLVAPYGRS